MLVAFSSPVVKMLIMFIIFGCGLFADARHSRIYNGWDARIEDYPYQVSIESKGNHICGGSIISENYVLTAAHCFSLVPSNASLSVRVGTSFRSKGGRLHTVTDFLRHEEYDGVATPVHDIAIVKVKEPFHYDATCQPIKMFKSNEETTPGAKSVVTGFGLVSMRKYADQLQAVDLTIVGKKECKMIQRNLREGQICAVGVNGNDSCTGDSGGPIAVDGRLAGIVSWGGACGDNTYPAAYTEMAHYRDWISKHVQ